MTTLVYVHGTNGSGKSTLARAVLAAAGGAQGVSKLASTPNATWTHTGRAGVVLAGKYGTACGGVDGMQPYDMPRARTRRPGLASVAMPLRAMHSPATYVAT